MKLADALTSSQKYFPLSLKSHLKNSQTFFTFPFGNLSYADIDIPHSSPRWGMSLRAAGSMRFRWNETNPIRDEFFKTLSSTQNATAQRCNKTFSDDKITQTTQISNDNEITLTPVPVQLDHTKIVYDVKSASNTFGKIGDGIITKNKLLIPTVTVADCMPIFLFDPITEVFGIVHSGWKGTGIIGEAIKLAEKNYGAKPSNFRIVLGPHIHDCCYIVDENRAKYFMENFCEECVRKIEDGEELPPFAWNNGNGSLYRLSLERANLSVLEKSGVQEENVTICDDCTACNPIFGSNRRETSQVSLGKAPNGNNSSCLQQTAEQANCNNQPFTVMAAFVMW